MRSYDRLSSRGIAILLSCIAVSAPLVAATIDLACNPRTPADHARDVVIADEAALTVTQIACIFGSSIVDPAALAEFCRVAPSLIPRIVPIVDRLIGQREAARSAGILWLRPDGGIATDGGGR